MQIGMFLVILFIISVLVFVSWLNRLAEKDSAERKKNEELKRRQDAQAEIEKAKTEELKRRQDAQTEELKRRQDVIEKFEKAKKYFEIFGIVRCTYTSKYYVIEYFDRWKKKNVIVEKDLETVLKSFVHKSEFDKAFFGEGQVFDPKEIFLQVPLDSNKK